jgi:hypothetical protein
MSYLFTPCLSFPPKHEQFVIIPFIKIGIKLDIFIKNKYFRLLKITPGRKQLETLSVLPSNPLYIHKYIF